ncbi:hypothetical protein [Sphingomonas sp.]|uniref:hypothetical protein n=1 Tax=Sphingomonas sp. TaxID=28214 RepID=UPI0025DF2B41|nr:hypothetical protein [Sphingomonas sp.]
MAVKGGQQGHLAWLRRQAAIDGDAFGAVLKALGKTLEAAAQHNRSFERYRIIDHRIFLF